MKTKLLPIEFVLYSGELEMATSNFSKLVRAIATMSDDVHLSVRIDSKVYCSLWTNNQTKPPVTLNGITMEIPILGKENIPTQIIFDIMNEIELCEVNMVYMGRSRGIYEMEFVVDGEAFSTENVEFPMIELNSKAFQVFCLFRWITGVPVIINAANRDEVL